MRNLGVKSPWVGVRGQRQNQKWFKEWATDGRWNPSETGTPERSILEAARKPGESFRFLSLVSATQSKVPCLISPSAHRQYFWLQTSGFSGDLPSSQTHSQHSPLAVNPETGLGLSAALGSSLSMGFLPKWRDRMSVALGTGRRPV